MGASSDGPAGPLRLSIPRERRFVAIAGELATSVARNVHYSAEEAGAIGRAVGWVVTALAPSPGPAGDGDAVELRFAVDPDERLRIDICSLEGPGREAERHLSQSGCGESGLDLLRAAVADVAFSAGAEGACCRLTCRTHRR